MRNPDTLITILDNISLPIEWAEDGAVPPAVAALVSAGTNGRVRSRDFSNSATQDVIFNWTVPDDIYATSGIKFKVKGIITASTAPAAGEGVSFKLSGYCVGTGDALDGSFGTEVESANTDLNAAGCAAQYDYFCTAYSGTVTITDLAAGEHAILHFERDQADSDDDYGQLIGVTEIVIQYTRTYQVP